VWSGKRVRLFSATSDAVAQKNPSAEAEEMEEEEDARSDVSIEPGDVILSEPPVTVWVNDGALPPSFPGCGATLR
jgi:hypothetical protein